MENKELIAQQTFCGTLEGHNGEVTSIVSSQSTAEGKDNNILISAGRDNKLLIWKLNPQQERNDEGSFGEPYLALTGHNHFVNDLSLSNDNNYVLSASWDRTLRLWNLKTGKCQSRFSGCPKEVLSCAFSSDSRQVLSSGFDNKVSLWNNKGEFKMGSQQSNHTDAVSRVRYSPSVKNNYFATAGWDGKLKIWTGFCKIKVSFVAHEGPIYGLAINTNGMYVATGGKDATVKLWKVTDINEPAKEYKCDSQVNDVAFNPEYQWVAAATNNSLRVWDVSSNENIPIVNIPVDVNSNNQNKKFKFTSLCWNATGKYLYAGCSDSKIRVYHIGITEKQ